MEPSTVENISEPVAPSEETTSIDNTSVETTYSVETPPAVVFADQSKKRKYSEVDQQFIRKYLLPLHVSDYCPYENKQFKEVFDDINTFHHWVSVNSKNRIRHNLQGTYVESRCKNLCTKRYLYFRLDQKSKELEREISKYKIDYNYYKKKYYDEIDYTKKLEAQIKELKDQLEHVKRENEDYSYTQTKLVELNKSLLNNQIMPSYQPQMYFPNSMYEQLLSLANNMNK